MVFGIGGQARPRYQKVMVDAEFTTEDHQVLTTITNWTEIAYYTILAQQKLRVGYGNPGQPQNQGHLYVIFNTGEASPKRNNYRFLFKALLSVRIIS